MNNNKKKNKLESILFCYWNGKEKLWKAFWIMGFFLQFLVAYILLFLLYLGTSIGLTWSIKIIIFLLSNAYTIWIWVSIWNCAYNVEKKIWGHISRFIVILNLIIVILIYSGFININFN